MKRPLIDIVAEVSQWIALTMLAALLGTFIAVQCGGSELVQYHKADINEIALGRLTGQPVVFTGYVISITLQDGSYRSLICDDKKMKVPDPEHCVRIHFAPPKHAWVMPAVGDKVVARGTPGAR